jgi:hypothetical protein
MTGCVPTGCPLAETMNDMTRLHYGMFDVRCAAKNSFIPYRSSHIPQQLHSSVFRQLNFLIIH